MPGKFINMDSTSVVATFSPFQRKVSPERSAKATCLKPWFKTRSPELNQLSPFLNTSRKIFLLLSSSDRKSTRLNSSHVRISYAVFCLKKKKKNKTTITLKTYVKL